MDVDEAAIERGEEVVRPVASDLRVRDVEMKTDRRMGVYQRAQLRDARELIRNILDHQPEAVRRGSFGEQGERFRVPRECLRRGEPLTGIGMDVDERRARCREERESALDFR